MSIFSKLVDDIVWSDLDGLLKEAANETVRLGFKREIPKKEDALKKLSSFANTYGGYVIIGAAEDGKGNLIAIDGIDAPARYDQTIFQWCFEGIYPPIIPVVSNPIPSPNDPAKSIYIIYIEESAEGPHFLNERKGCFVRTDEYSQRFEPRLATLSEIEFLQNRRQRAIQLREFIFNRANQRFTRHMASKLSTDKGTNQVVKPSFTLSVTPRFPGSMRLVVQRLRETVNSTMLSARGTIFPHGQIESQPDGFYFLDPRMIDPSYFEVDLNGCLYYQELLTPEANEKNETFLFLSRVFSQVILYLMYARKLYEQSGYDGSLNIRVLLKDIAGISFAMPLELFSAETPRLDDSIRIDHECQVSVLRKDLVPLLRKLLRTLCFSCGHMGSFDATDNNVDAWLERSLNYLSWDWNQIS